MFEAQSSQAVVQRPRSSLPFWVSAMVVISAFLMATGALIALIDPAMLAHSDEKVGEAVRVYAGYLVSRNLAIAILLVGTLMIGARRALGTMMLVTALIQILDAVIDCFEARWTIVPGVLVIAVLLLFGASKICQQRFWKVEFWREPC